MQQTISYLDILTIIYSTLMGLDLMGSYTILGNTFIIIIKDFLDSLNSSFLGSCLIPFNHDLLSLEYLGTQPSQVPGYS